MEKCLFRFSAPFFFNQVVYFFDIELHELFILEINPLLVDSFAIIFSVGCLFVLCIVSFTVQKPLSLIRPHLLISVFIFITLRGGSKKM